MTQPTLQQPHAKYRFFHITVSSGGLKIASFIRESVWNVDLPSEAKGVGDDWNMAISFCGLYLSCALPADGHQGKP